MISGSIGRHFRYWNENLVNELAEYNLTVNDLLSLATPEKIAEYLKDNLLMDLDFSKYSLDDACPLNESQLNVYLDIIKYEKKSEVYNIPLTINYSRKITLIMM